MCHFFTSTYIENKFFLEAGVKHPIKALKNWKEKQNLTVVSHSTDHILCTEYKGLNDDASVIVIYYMT